MDASVVLIGNESVGKSQLAASLSGRSASSANFRGTTVACETYPFGAFLMVDTPGILFRSDSETSRLALAEMESGDQVLLVVSAARLDHDLDDLLPLVRERRGVLAVTFWDMVNSIGAQARGTIAALSAELGVPVVPLDARRLGPRELDGVKRALQDPGRFANPQVRTRSTWRLAPPRGLFHWPLAGPLAALALVLAPTWIAVQNANLAADWFYDDVQGILRPVLEELQGWPAPLSNVLAGSYGLFSMGPFLILYALPTVVVFAFIIALYKCSGLIDRVSVALHPWLRPFGLTGRDLVRVIMGFGCNVPAVINSRSCSTCSRGACVSAISFGSACSYQFPATLAVFAAAGLPHLALPYLGLLAVTTLTYLRLTAGSGALAQVRRLSISGRDYLQPPRVRPVVRETLGVLRQFVSLALPIFVVICLAAGLMEWSGLLDWLVWAMSPLMGLFNLPGEASVAVLMGSVRKDGIAIGLLDGSWDALKVPLSSPMQVLTVVYLAGVLLPCLVTLVTVVREMKAAFALRMVARQVAAAVLFSLILAWGGFMLVD